MSKILKRLSSSFIICFLLTFMLLIFGTSEIFFANVTQFDFVYSEFIGYVVMFALIATVILTAIIIILPDKMYRALLSIVCGVSVAGYIQVMFLNKNLDLLGLNPEGYQVGAVQASVNTVIWLVIIGLIFFLAFWKKDIWKKVVISVSAFLLCIQLVALVSLVITADEEAYTYPEGNKVYWLSGENQYKVSANNNVIVIILDYFSNQYLEPLEVVYPGATDFLHDFTYYNNTDCVYYGTFPSIAHMFTGVEVDGSVPINEWTKQIWEDEKTCNFYNMLMDNGYIVNFYTPEAKYLSGQNKLSVLEGKIANVANDAREVEVNYRLLNKTLIKMSGYRMCPELLKPYFYTDLSEYTEIVSYKSIHGDYNTDPGIRHENHKFLKGLREQGLTKDNKSNYLIVQHLMGAHEYTTDENGNYKENSTREETTKGCMVIVEEYLNQLKDLGVYDSSTIIITADHGDAHESQQVIFYIKEPYESHEISPVSNAPISLCELLPTIAEIIGVDYSEYGQSIHDFSQDEERERTLWVREYDEAYPRVLNFAGSKDGKANVYYGYSYVGSYQELINQTEQGPTVKMQMADSFW